MPFHDVFLAAFSDELEKIAASYGRMHFPKERSGRRSISVAKLLKRETEGKLFKKHGDAEGNPQSVRGAGSDDPGAAPMPHRKGEVPTKDTNYPDASTKMGAPGAAYGDVTPVINGESPFDYMEAKKPRKKGDVPSKDDSNVIDRYDQRDNATTVTGLGQSSTGIGAFNSPAEHT